MTYTVHHVDRFYEMPHPASADPGWVLERVRAIVAYIDPDYSDDVVISGLREALDDAEDWMRRHVAYMYDLGLLVGITWNPDDDQTRQMLELHDLMCNLRRDDV